MQGPGWPALGTEPMDLVTTPPAPARDARQRDAPVVPRMPAARRTGFFRSRPPAWTERDGIVRDGKKKDKSIGIGHTAKMAVPI